MGEERAVVYEGREVESRIALMKLEEAGIEAEILASPLAGESSPFLPECLSGLFQISVQQADRQRAVGILKELG